MITRDGVTYPGTRDELLATGRWLACDKERCPCGCGAERCPRGVVRSSDGEHVTAIDNAIAAERDRALVAALSAVRAERDAARAEIERRQAALAVRSSPRPDREALGQLVRAVWIAWEQEQPNPKPSWLVPWEGLAEPDREVDRRIGERLACEGAPTRERVIEALAAAICRDEEDIAGALDEPCFCGECKGLRAAARLLGLDVREPRDGQEAP